MSKNFVTRVADDIIYPCILRWMYSVYKSQSLKDSLSLSQFHRKTWEHQRTQRAVRFILRHATPLLHGHNKLCNAFLLRTMTTNSTLQFLSSGWISLLQANSRSTRRLGEYLVVATSQNCRHHCLMSQRIIHVQSSVHAGRGISFSSMRNGGNICTAPASFNGCHNNRSTSRLLAAISPTRRTLHKNHHNNKNNHHHANKKHHHHHHHRHKNAAAIASPQQPHSTTTTTITAAPSILYAPTAAAATSVATDPLSNVTKWQKLRSLFITGAIPMVRSSICCCDSKHENSFDKGSCTFLSLSLSHTHTHTHTHTDWIWFHGQFCHDSSRSIH